MSDPRQTIADQLSLHLDAELAAHRRMLSCAEVRLKAAIAADHRALAAAGEREAPVIAELHRLRQVRERLVRAAAGICALREVPTLTALCGKLPAAAAERIAARGRELRALLDRLRAIEDHCAAILRHGIALVRDLLDAVAGVERPVKAPYDRRGTAYAAHAGVAGNLVDLRG